MFSRIYPKYELTENEEVIIFVEDFHEDDEIPWEFDQLEKEQVRMDKWKCQSLVWFGGTRRLSCAWWSFVHNTYPPSARFHVILRAHTEIGQFRKVSAIP